MSNDGVVLELERHLRSTFGDADARLPAPARPKSARLDTSTLVEAISRAAVSMSDKAAQVVLLEQKQRELEDHLNHIHKECTDLLRRTQAAEAKADLQMERAERAEAKAARLEAREEALVEELEQSRSDLERLAAAVLELLNQEEQSFSSPKTRRSIA